MKNYPSPFVRHGGRTYLVANFQLEPADDHPHLPDVLADLLASHDPSDILILRPLTGDEEAFVEQATEDAEVDTWAHIVGFRK